MSLDWPEWFRRLGADLGAVLAETIGQGKPPTDAGAEVLHLAIELEQLATKIADDHGAGAGAGAETGPTITLQALDGMRQTLLPDPLTEVVPAGLIRVEFNCHRHVCRWVIETPGHQAAIAHTPESALRHVEERRRWPATPAANTPEAITEAQVAAMSLTANTLIERQPDGSVVLVEVFGTWRVPQQWRVERRFPDDRPTTANVARSSGRAMVLVHRHRRDGGRA